MESTRFPLSDLPCCPRAERRRKRSTGRWSTSRFHQGSGRFPGRGSGPALGRCRRWRCQACKPDWCLEYRWCDQAKLQPADWTLACDGGTSATHWWPARRGTRSLRRGWRRFHGWSQFQWQPAKSPDRLILQHQVSTKNKPVNRPYDFNVFAVADSHWWH